MNNEEGKFGLIRLMALCLLVVVLMVVTPLLMIKKKTQIITGEELWGEKSEFQGVLEVWNVDTFGGAIISKSDFLEQVAREFESNNKGVYVCVKNMKIDEFKIAIGEGRLPNVISFGSGVGKLIEENLEHLGEFNSVNSKVLDSGKSGDSLKAVGYIMDMYGLFSSTDKIGALQENQKLSDIMFTSGKDVVKKKSTKHIYSINYGKSEYIHPERALGENIKDCLISTGDYAGYMDFVNFNKSNILLGNMRDMVRLKRKVEKGDMSDIIVEPITKYNDLIQYVGLIKQSNDTIKKCAELFLNNLLSESVQKQIYKTGLFSTTGEILYDTNENFKMFECQIDKIENIPNVFL